MAHILIPSPDYKLGVRKQGKILLGASVKRQLLDASDSKSNTSEKEATNSSALKDHKPITEYEDDGNNSAAAVAVVSLPPVVASNNDVSRFTGDCETMLQSLEGQLRKLANTYDHLTCHGANQRQLLYSGRLEQALEVVACEQELLSQRLDLVSMTHEEMEQRLEQFEGSDDTEVTATPRAQERNHAYEQLAEIDTWCERTVRELSGIIDDVNPPTPLVSAGGEHIPVKATTATGGAREVELQHQAAQKTILTHRHMDKVAYVLNCHHEALRRLSNDIEEVKCELNDSVGSGCSNEVKVKARHLLKHKNRNEAVSGDTDNGSEEYFDATDTVSQFLVASRHSCPSTKPQILQHNISQ